MVTDLILQKRSAKYKRETLKRSLLKTISWRVIGTLDTVLIAYLITGRVYQENTRRNKYTFSLLCYGGKKSGAIKRR